jgi:serpin B
VSLATQISMKPVLTELGMGVAFTPSADFTGLSSQACCIGLVEQAATLGIGEKGTVASAATAVGMHPTAARVMPAQIVFNRPYLMVVTDRATGEPLFMARVANPANQ